MKKFNLTTKNNTKKKIKKMKKLKNFFLKRLKNTIKTKLKKIKSSKNLGKNNKTKKRVSKKNKIMRKKMKGGSVKFQPLTDFAAAIGESVSQGVATYKGE